MFRSAVLKLTGLYLTIIVIISLFFSLAVYQVSMQEFRRGLRRGPNISRGSPILRQIQEDRQIQYELVRSSVVSRLLISNIIILSIGGLLSYYLALRTLKPIEEAHAAQHRFTADASHELRTPIAAMQTETEVTLMNPKLTLTEAKSQLSSNLEELSKLSYLTERLLSLARSENIELSVDSVNIDLIIKDAVNQVAPLASKKSIQLRTLNASKAIINADRVSLVEAIVILLENAIKYSPEKSQVNIKLGITKKIVSIHIMDSGPGIAKSHQAHVFDRFYRVEQSRSKEKTGGFGIGLSIAKEIIERNYGTIRVKSQLNAGTTFTIELPVA
jgi:two-component system, OmpR family, sensor histidine kinase CiaH